MKKIIKIFCVLLTAGLMAGILFVYIGMFVKAISFAKVMYSWAILPLAVLFAAGLWYLPSPKKIHLKLYNALHKAFYER
jgi:TM2 domain-containing membrane protein YozV